MPNIATSSPTPEGRRRLERAVERSQRRSVSFFPSFYRDDSLQNVPPLAQLLRGGHGGEVRLKLYMTMKMLATRAPHDIRNTPARVWASMLALPDPDVNGARRISDALSSLESANLVQLERRPGMPPTITVLEAPVQEVSLRTKNWWVNIPIGFWSYEWIYHLSAGAVALIIITRDMRSNLDPSQPPWLSGRDRKRYGISDDTWTRARKELEELGLLSITRVPQSRDLDYRRLRNTYWLDIEQLDEKMPVR
ncbi:hypothetical protein ACIBSW_27575 [Actinoplanes sp. NPDC049668]|uniref:hypothetical protein n=1 Tax=unclassified Actinoplanes TaxID=2626549 RepID=UPI0033ACEF62